jgi:hypothetical protein
MTLCRVDHDELVYDERRHDCPGCALVKQVEIREGEAAKWKSDYSDLEDGLATVAEELDEAKAKIRELERDLGAVERDQASGSPWRP